MGHDRTRIVDSNHFHEARERAERDDMRPVRPSSLVYIVVGRRPGLAAPRGSSASANMVARRRTGVVITDFHAKYFAYEFGRRCSSDSVEKLTAVLADAQVDLNPHQIEAALFAFRSPFSKGAILADEVGLGKTIEAGLLLAQKWVERTRRMLVIVPANLRKQWSQELADKFYLPSVILEARSVEAARLQDDGRQVELVRQLLRPLFAQVGRHDHQHPARALDPLLRQQQPSLDRLPQPHLVGEDGALGKRAAEGEERRLDLMRVEIDLRVGENSSELLDAVGRAALGDLVGEVLGVEVGDHERRALPFGSRGRHVVIRYVQHNACAAPRAMVTPMVVLTTSNPGRRSAHVRVR